MIHPIVFFGIVSTIIYIVTYVLKYRYNTRNQQLKELSTAVDNLESVLEGKPLPQESWKQLYEKERTKYEEVELLYQGKCSEVAELKLSITELQGRYNALDKVISDNIKQFK